VNHKDDISDALLHVTDIVPTILEVAGVEHPSKQAGSSLAPLEGKSMVPLLSGKADTIRGDNDWLGWELFGNRAIRQGDWKLRYLLKRQVAQANGSCSPAQRPSRIARLGERQPR
jgi:arylsulfatase A-like enzyme